MWRQDNGAIYDKAGEIGIGRREIRSPVEEDKTRVRIGVQCNRGAGFNEDIRAGPIALVGDEDNSRPELSAGDGAGRSASWRKRGSRAHGDEIQLNPIADGHISREAGNAWAGRYGLNRIGGWLGQGKVILPSFENILRVALRIGLNYRVRRLPRQGRVGNEHHQVLAAGRPGKRRGLVVNRAINRESGARRHRGYCYGAESGLSL